MSCYCDYDAPTMFSEVWHKAAKEHKCCECGGVIGNGQQYQHVAAVYDGTFRTYKTCEKCADLRDALQEVSCPTFCGLAEEYFEYLNQFLPSQKRDEVYYNVFPTKGQQ